MFILIFNITQYWHLQEKKKTKKAKQIQFQCDVKCCSTYVLAHVNSAVLSADDDLSLPQPEFKLLGGMEGWYLTPSNGIWTSERNKIYSLGANEIFVKIINVRLCSTSQYLFIMEAII